MPYSFLCFISQSLLEVHDAIAFKTYALPPTSPVLSEDPGTVNGFGSLPIRMVGLHKQPNKPLVCYKHFELIAQYHKINTDH